MQEEFKAPTRPPKRSKEERQKLAAKLSESVGTIVMADMKDEARPDIVVEEPQIETGVKKEPLEKIEEEPEEQKSKEVKKPRVKDRFEADFSDSRVDDEDPRFLHVMFEETGADLKRRFFKNTTATYLMAKCKQLENYNTVLFRKFMDSGKILVEAANTGDLQLFKETFAGQVDKEIMYWHVTKALKEAIKK